MRSQTAFERFRSSTNHSWFHIAFTLLRVGLGVVFFSAGLAKFGNEWSAAGYLSHATGPFASFFQSLAGNPVVDQLNIWGLTLIGGALLLGLAVRPASFFGIVIMVLYYLSGFEDNTAHGIVDEHIIYSLILFLFLAGGAGHGFGLDALMERYFPKRKQLARILFG